MPAAIEPKENTGPTTTKVSKPVRDSSKRTMRNGRPPKTADVAPPVQFQSEYEKSRVSEITTRAALYKRKLQKLDGELLDRKVLSAELSAMFTSIREIILGSKLTQREKEDCLSNLGEIPVMLDNVAAKQSKEEKDETGTQNGHSDLN